MPILLLGQYSVGILVRFTFFLSTVHWPTGSDDLGHFGSLVFRAFDPFRAKGWSKGH